MKNLLIATQTTTPNLEISEPISAATPTGDILVGGSIAAGVGVFLIKEVVTAIRDWHRHRLELAKTKEAAELAEEQADQTMLQDMIRDLREQNKVLRDQNQTLVLEICQLRRMMDMSGPVIAPLPKTM